jgi:hypothetical protein
MSVRVRQDVGMEDVHRVLAESLGSDWTVTPTSDVTVRVERNPLMWATIRLSRATDTETTFHVRPGGILLVAMYNAVYTVPLVRRALRTLG